LTRRQALDSHPTHAWQVLHPPLQTSASGWLDVGDGHRMYWEAAGHPRAPAALFVHGGPGTGCSANDRRWFDPRRWRIVLFDQRGAGRSLPRAGLAANDTPHLVADMEALREHLGIERWLLFGGSWGATLALAYAEQHPRRVTGLVLRGVFTATRAERCWLYGARGAARHHPAAWQRLHAAAGAAPGQGLLEALHVRLHAGGTACRAAAQAWWRWEHDLMDAETTGPAPAPPAVDDDAALAHARIGVHYARRDWFLEPGQLLARASCLQGLPGVIVQGSRDLVTPPAAARALHAAWPGAQWQEVSAAGHASSHPAIARQLVAATDAFADTASPTTPQEAADARPASPH